MALDPEAEAAKAASHKLTICEKCGWYSHTFGERCSPDYGAAADRLCSAVPEVPATKLGYGSGNFTFELDECFRIRFGCYPSGYKLLDVWAIDTLDVRQAADLVRSLVSWRRACGVGTSNVGLAAAAVESAVDTALGEVARQQGGIAHPLAADARGEGIRHGRFILGIGATLEGRPRAGADARQRFERMAEVESRQASVDRVRWQQTLYPQPGVAITEVAPDPEHPHLIDGEFQSDKYPTTPRGKVPLSTKDPTAQDLLWQYAQRRRSVDAAFSNDLEIALRAKGYSPPVTPLEEEKTKRGPLIGTEKIADILGSMTTAHMLNRGIAAMLERAIGAWSEHLDGTSIEWRRSEAGQAEAEQLAEAEAELARFRGFELRQQAKLGAEIHNLTKKRDPGCECHQEEGDSPCPVHGTESS